MREYDGIAEALKWAGEKLQQETANPISTEQLVALVVQKRRSQNRPCSPGSVIPSDHCYNLKNDGHANRKFEPMFLCVSRGKFFYVGEGFKWIGTIDRHPKGGTAKSTQI